jgi:hypothetical protein
MSSEIINRVEKSSLRTIDPGLFYQNIEVISFDLKPFLRDGLLLIEKDFRKSIEDHNWNQYTDKGVSIVCSNEAIVPDWAFMLVSSKLENLNITHIIGSNKDLVIKLLNEAINNYDFDEFENKSVIIKGCSEQKIPLAAYSMILKKLQPVAKSIMFGEACSSVPIYKSKK